MEEVRQDKQIFVIACPNSGCEKSIANLKSEDITYQEDFVGKLDDMASQYPKSKFLLLYNQADIALGYALQAGEEPKNFLSLWEEINRKLITFSRKNRSNSILENASIFIQNPEALSKAFEKLSGKNSLTITEDDISSPLPSIERLLARQLLSDYPHLEKLNEELDASSMPIGDFILNNTFDNEIIYQEYIDQIKLHNNLSKQFDGYLKKNHELKEENELLLLQLHTVQEELEKTLIQSQDLEKQLRKELGDHKNSVSEYNSQLSSIQLQLTQKAKEVDEKSKKLKTFEAKLSSLSALEKQHEELSQEYEQLLLQLHSVEEELETYYPKNNELLNPVDNIIQVDTQPEHSGQEKNNGFFSNWKNIRRRQKYEKKQMKLIKDSGEFDTSWYLNEYPDVAEAQMDPILHYLRFGYKEGRNPSKEFNTKAYLMINSDVNQEGMNPLYHYVKFGKAEGRSPLGEF